MDEYFDMGRGNVPDGPTDYPGAWWVAMLICAAITVVLILTT